VSFQPQYLKDIQARLKSNLRSEEHFFASFNGEHSQFLRINAAKVRQVGTVRDGEIGVTLVRDSGTGALKKCSLSCTLTGQKDQDFPALDATLKKLQGDIDDLPVDPYAQLPSSAHPSNVSETQGALLSPTESIDAILSEDAKKLDLAGIYASGPIYRAMMNSEGLFHWFGTETFSFDYSIYTRGQKAVKGAYAGTRWNQQEYAQSLKSRQSHLEMLTAPSKKVDRGSYRTFLAPAAFGDLIGMMSWGTISEAAIQQGDSALKKLREQKIKLSPLFSLSEDFSGGWVPRFNGEGEIAAEKLALFEKGEFKNSLVSTRTQKEYGVKSNFAGGHEGLRSPVVDAGSLDMNRALEALGTGLYLSNLHYLNWSDQAGGRITGMTRYACFWVENGKIVAPIENLRWDDSIFNFFGANLEALTTQRELQPEVGTYEARQLGGMLVPGALMSKMAFTL
jgi:predicted Zn-dependent protease